MNVNEYFDGNVKSIGFENSEGKVTSGVMAVGDYEFGTSEHELMKVVSGAISAKLPGASDYVKFATARSQWQRHRQHLYRFGW